MASPDSERERQAAVRAWIESGAPFGGRRPEVISTHGNLLFLTDTQVYKMKRVVDFGWMDFSTLEKRAAACRQELELNRRTAPELYCRVVAVTEEEGSFALDGAGPAVEWLVEMRRFEESQRLDRLAERGELTGDHLVQLADSLAAFHAEAEQAGPRDFAAVLDRIVQENEADMGRAGPLSSASERETLCRLSLESLDRHRSLIAERTAQGWLRRCHGDLHLANLVLWKGKATPFDCIEFNEDFIAIDLLYDLAFLLMDLEQRGRRDLANLVLNRWLAMAPGSLDQFRGLALLPLLLSIRAGVRAKVGALTWLESEEGGRDRLAEEARHYLARARSYLELGSGALLAVGGLSGTGKSSLAARLAPAIGVAPGAIHLRSDVLRKRLWDRAPEERLPAEAYGEDWNRRVAEALLARAGAALEAGCSVIVDAVSADPAFRGPLQELARRQGSPFTGLWLEAPLPILRDRVEARRADASDATAAVVERQAAEIAPPEDWARLDASGTAEETLALAGALLAGRSGR